MAMCERAPRVFDVPETHSEIKTHEREHCKFEPQLGEDAIRKNVAGSNYGKGPIQHFERPSPTPNPDEIFHPKLDHCNIRERISSSGYGKRNVIDVYEKRAASADPTARVQPTFKPETNKRGISAKIKKEVPSSGYGCRPSSGQSKVYRPGQALRGELARQRVQMPPQSTPSFQPQLHLSKKAKELRETVKARREQTEKWHSRPREPRLYSPKAWTGPPCEIATTPSRTSASSYFDNDYQGGFILDGVAVGFRGGSGSATVGGDYRGAYRDYNSYSSHAKHQQKPKGKIISYDINGRAKRA
eukprot:m.734291 g.734291  ORF g.734291 m.734291 type:complete len:301 (+) comp23081_c0_seq1:155-1057(+)